MHMFCNRRFPVESKTMNSTSQGNRHVTATGPAAFTLIELLVFVAIIALLAALLIPTISRSKTNAQQIRCVSNLRQLGVGLQNFLVDNHAYPSLISPPNSKNPGLWISQLAYGGFGISIPVTNPATNLLSKGIWRCPSSPLKMPPPNDDSDFSSYGYNAHGVARPGWPGNTNEKTEADFDGTVAWISDDRRTRLMEAFGPR